MKAIESIQILLPLTIDSLLGGAYVTFTTSSAFLVNSIVTAHPHVTVYASLRQLS